MCVGPVHAYASGSALFLKLISDVDEKVDCEGNKLCNTQEVVLAVGLVEFASVEFTRTLRVPHETVLGDTGVNESS